MKVFLILLTTFVVLTTQDQSCQHQTDCQTGQCCVHTGILGGDHLELLGRKRLLFSHTGICQPFRQVNETCLPFMTHDIFNHELYERHCPCGKPLECRGETVHESPNGVQHINPKCQAAENKVLS